METDYKKTTRDYLYKTNKKNKDIDKIINTKYKELESLNEQIKLLQSKLDNSSYELQILTEIKNSQQTFIVIDKKIEEYVLNLKKQDILNKWCTSFSSETEGFSTTMYSIKNATYSGTIIIHHNKKSDFFKINYELTISSILLNLAKENKMLFLNLDDIRIFQEGKVIFNEKDAENYIDTLKTQYDFLFCVDKAPLQNKFKDITGVEYNSSDFITYDGLTIDGFKLKDNILNN